MHSNLVSCGRHSLYHSHRDMGDFFAGQEALYKSMNPCTNRSVQISIFWLKSQQRIPEAIEAKS